MQSSNLIQHRNGSWAIRFNGQEASCPDSVGMLYIHHLIRKSQKEVHVTELVTKANGEPEEITEAKELMETGVALIGEKDGFNNVVSEQVVTAEFKDVILTDEDRAYVWDLLEQEKENLTKLKSKGKPREVLLKKEEIRTIEKYMRAHRFGSSNTCFPNRESRDRISVRNAIKRGIEKLKKVHAPFAKHLRESIDTGTLCIYAPVYGTSWQL